MHLKHVKSYDNVGPICGPTNDFSYSCALTNFLACERNGIIFRKKDKKQFLCSPPSFFARLRALTSTFMILMFTKANVDSVFR